VSGDFPGREVFFPVRTPPAREGWPREFLLPAAAGALAALSLVGLVALARRPRRRDAEPTPVRAGEDAARAARSALEIASELAPSNPRHASDLASGALRLHLSRRFRAPAMTRTTEELEAADPPRELASGWPGLVALLRGLDAVRFAPPGASEREQAVDAIREAQALAARLAALDRWQ
jgi:hypothetical protein